MSVVNRQKWQNFSPDEIDLIILMAWDDTTTYESIFTQFDLTANELAKFMRAHLGDKTYKRWRRRLASHGHTKNGGSRPEAKSRLRPVAKDSMEQLRVGNKIFKF